MKPINVVTALSRLLTKPDLLDQFESHPGKIAALLNVAEEERPCFVALSPQQIRAQAKLLITKRQREVYTLLPHTFNQLGTDVTAIFEKYAVDYWPNTHQRHLEDAIQFARYLKSQPFPVSQDELNHLQFLSSGRRIRLALVKNTRIKGKWLPALQLCYRSKGTINQWRFYLKG